MVCRWYSASRRICTSSRASGVVVRARNATDAMYPPDRHHLARVTGRCDNARAMRDELRDGGDASLAWRLLFGLASGEPGTGEELGDAVGGPASGDLVDGVDEVNVGVDAGKLAVEQDGEHVRVALASVEAADEQRVLPERGHDAQQALDVGVGDREAAIVEEGAQGRLLPGPVVDGLAERGLLVDLGRDVDDRALELAPQGYRLGLPQREPPGGVEVALGRAPLDVVQGAVQIDHRLRAAVALLEGLREPAPSVVVASDAPGRV